MSRGGAARPIVRAGHFSVPEGRASLWLFLIAATGTVALYGSFVLSESTARWLTYEDGPFEYAGALSLALASTICLYLGWTVRSRCDFRVVRTSRNPWLLALGLAFAFGAIEEVSWGQRLFGLDTPELMQRYNMQGEINLHNLAPVHGDIERSGIRYFLTIEKLFALFWISYCVGLPLIVRVNTAVRGLAERVGLPVPPLWLSAVFPVNYAIAKLHECLMLDEHMHGPLSEVKEASFEILLLALAISFLQTRSRRSGDEASVAEER